MNKNPDLDVQKTWTGTVRGNNWEMQKMIGYMQENEAKDEDQFE